MAGDKLAALQQVLSHARGLDRVAQRPLSVERQFVRLGLGGEGAGSPSQSTRSRHDQSNGNGQRDLCRRGHAR